MPKLIRRHPDKPANRLPFAIRASECQSRFLAMPMPRMFVGGIGAGKTMAGLLSVLQMPAGSRGCILAPTFPMLRDIIMETFMQTAGALILNCNRSTMELTLVGQRSILLRSAQKPDRLRGLNLDWLWIDEATYITYEAFLVAVGRLRKSPRSWWLTCTPVRPSWVYDQFIDPQSAGTEMIHVLSATSRENPFLSPDFVDRLRLTYGSLWAQRELEAQWIQLSGGLIDPDWVRVADILSGEPGCHRAIGIDLAAGLDESSDYTAVVVVTAHPSGRIQVEHASRGRWTFQEQIEHVVRLADSYETRTIMVESNAYQLIFAHELMRRGLPVQNVQARAKKEDRIRALAPRYEMGLITHARRFPDLEAELLTYPESRNDDLLDALVYAISGALAIDPNAMNKLRVRPRQTVL